jgi:serine/threonine protein kinase
VLDAGVLNVPEAVTLACFLLDAAQFFSGHDLVHGDIKPENILVLRDAAQMKFKLIDFGSVTGTFSITSRAGTPSFLAPERFRGDPISERTEIFSIGVTLFLALSGKYPYGEIEPFQTPAFRAPLRLTGLNAHIPAWLESVALRAVAVEPDDRYQTYSEMKFDLQNPEKVRPWFRKDTPLLERNPLLFYKTGFFILAIVVLLLLGMLLNHH